MSVRVVSALPAALAASLLIPLPAPAQPPAGPARCLDVGGVLLQRQGADGPWQPVRGGAAVRADDLLVALPDAGLVSANGAVQVQMAVDIAQRGPLPVLEPALRFHQAKGFDLDVTLDRGIVAFKNVKKEGPARVRVRFHGDKWDLTLKSPGTAVGMEIFGRHAPGVPKCVCDEARGHFKDVPNVEVFLLVLAGKAMLTEDGRETALESPPGIAMVHWNSLTKDEEYRHLDELPPSLKPDTPEELARLQEARNAFRRLAVLPLDAGLELMLESDSPVERRAAVVALGALDMLPRLGAALGDTQHPEVRNLAVIVLRSWIGRGTGQAEYLYDYLTKGKELSPVQTKGVLHLLFGFDEKERRDPLTYEVLIESLKHSKPQVRHLSHWHLVRLVPEGQKIDYDAGAPAADLDRAYQEWRRLVPPGRLPPGLEAPKK
jgi:hypothetical protein